MKNQKIGEASKRWYYRLMWVSALLFAIGSFFIDTSGAGTVGNEAGKSGVNRSYNYVPSKEVIKKEKFNG